MARKIIFCGLSILIIILTFAYAGEVKLTTYYPAPYGEYKKIITETLGAGDNDGSGVIDSADAPDPATQPGQVWIAQKLQIGTTTEGAPALLVIKQTNSQVSDPSTIVGMFQLQDSGEQTMLSIYGYPHCTDNSYLDNTIMLYAPAESASDNLQLVAADTASGTIRFHIGAGNSSATECMRIATNGKVGIGTTTPNYALEICKSLYKGFSIGTGGDAGRIYTDYISYDPNLIFYDMDDPGVIRFRQSPGTNNENNPEHEAIIAGFHGNVGIGTMLPSFALDVRAPGDTWIRVDTTNVDTIHSDAGIVLDEGSVRKWHIFNNGTSDKLVFANSSCEWGAYITQGRDFYIPSLSGKGTGDVFCSASGGLYRGSSDQRFKKNIRTISEEIDVIDSLKQLRGVYFNWNTELVKKLKDLDFDDKRQMGMIAQEVEKVIPELVGTDNEGYRTLSYSRLVGFLIEVNKVQQRQIEELNVKVEALAKRQREN